MKPQRFGESNSVMTATKDMENCADVHAFTDGDVCITAWRPTPEELVKINLGEPVWLSIKMGGKMPPVLVTADYPFQEREVRPAP